MNLKVKLEPSHYKEAKSIENVRISDRVRTKDLLSKNKLLSVNQTMAQIKITEMWKDTKTTHHATCSELVVCDYTQIYIYLYSFCETLPI